MICALQCVTPTAYAAIQDRLSGISQMTLKNAREMFPNMPEAVFGIWLAPLIEADGWPFSSKHTCTYGTVWNHYLDGYPIQAIMNLRWTRCQVERDIQDFEQCSQRRICWIIDAHVKGLRTPCSNLKHGRARESFFRSRNYIAQTGKLHTPAVLMKTWAGVRIMDGNHRIAASFSLKLPHWFRLDSWVGA